MSFFHALILGIVQGLSEFFPISSSGHLILLPRIFGWPDQGLAFDTVLHLGTLTALVWFFRSDLFSLIQRFFRRDASAKPARRFVFQLMVASLPALVLGYVFDQQIENYARNVWLVAIDLAFWALVLLAADRFASRKNKSGQEIEAITWKQTIVVGLAQPVALLPGTSRSGITITAGLFSGLSREGAARFSFLLSIPVTAAAGFYGLWKLVRHGGTSDGTMPLLIGFLAAAISGAWAIRFLLSYVAKRRYDAFIIYRLALAVVVLLAV